MPEIPNFASLFGFECRVSSLESDMSELKQTNQFAEALSSIPGIADKYLKTKVKDTVDVAVQLKLEKLREEAQVENQDFLNTLDSNVKRIIKEQVKAQTSKIMTKVEKYVTETLEAEVLVRSTNQPQTSYAVASSLSELELKKILMDKMEENNSINRFDVQKNLYRALLEAYNSDKDLSSYGSKRQRSGKEESSKEATQKKSKSTSSSKGTTRSPPKSSGKSVQEEEHDPRVDDLEEPFHQEFDTGNDDVSPVREATDVDERLWNPSGSRTPDREWNQTKTVDDRPPQQWMTKLAQASGTTSSFNEFLATPIDFSAFIMNRLNIQHLTQDLLTGPTYDLIKGTCKSVVELEYHLEEVFKATNDQLDWHNPEGRPYPHDLSKPLPLIPDARERVEDLQLVVENYQKKINLTIPDTYRSNISKKTLYTAYRDIQGIIYQDDMNRNHLMRTDELHKFSDGTLNHVRTSLNDIATGIQMEYLPKRKWSLSNLLTGPTYDLIKGTCKSVVELEYHLEEVFKATNDQLDWHNPEGRPTKAADYGHIKWIEDKIPRSTWSEAQVVYDKHAYWGTYHWGPKRQRFYGYATNIETSKESIQNTGKLTNLNVDERFALNVALRMYTRRIVIQERVEDLQLAVESYQKKINLTKPDTYRSDIKHPSDFIHNEDGNSASVNIKQAHELELVLGRSLRIRRKLKDGGEEFQRSFRHSDTERLSRSDKVLKLKNFKKDATLKLFKSTNQESVDTDDFMTPLPEGWPIRSTVRSIVLGEREQDSFLVINLSGKVVQYNLLSKTLLEIYDCGSNQLDDNHDDDELLQQFEAEHNIYEFIPSFASV
ncbi:hypothetical protein Tco_0212394 [Tanacetum coccineum]